MSIKTSQLREAKRSYEAQKCRLDCVSDNKNGYFVPRTSVFSGTISTSALFFPNLEKAYSLIRECSNPNFFIFFLWKTHKFWQQKSRQREFSQQKNVNSCLDHPRLFESKWTNKVSQFLKKENPSHWWIIGVFVVLLWKCFYRSAKMILYQNWLIFLSWLTSIFESSSNFGSYLPNKKGWVTWSSK